MRTRVQNAKRYFAWVWLVFALLLAVASFSIIASPNPVIDGVVIGFAVLTALAAGLVGFVQGATMMHAKQLDEFDEAEEQEYASGQGFADED